MCFNSTKILKNTLDKSIKKKCQLKTFNLKKHIKFKNYIYLVQNILTNALTNHIENKIYTYLPNMVAKIDK